MTTAMWTSYSRLRSRQWWAARIATPGSSDREAPPVAPRRRSLCRWVEADFRVGRGSNMRAVRSDKRIVFGNPI